VFRRRALPWWLKVSILLVLGVPLIVPLIALRQSTPAQDLTQVLILTAYASLIWLVIALASGLENLFAYLSVAFFFAVSTMLGTVVLSKLPGLFPGLGTGSQRLDIQLFTMLLITISGVPLTLFGVQWFSASRLVERLQSSGRGAFRLKVAAVLRVFQHLAEIFPQLVIVWREENPELWLPRHRTDWTLTPWTLPGFADWLYRAFYLWATCMLMHFLRIVPVIDIELGRLEETIMRSAPNATPQ
jgi:hypothetical protein